MIHILLHCPPHRPLWELETRGNILEPQPKYVGTLQGKDGLCTLSLFSPLWLKNISWKCTFTVFIDLSSDGLQLVGSEACLKNLTSIQANGICFAILNNKEISSVNEEQGKHFPDSLLDPCVQQGITGNH